VGAATEADNKNDSTHYELQLIGVKALQIKPHTYLCYSRYDHAHEQTKDALTSGTGECFTVACGNIAGLAPEITSTDK
jgi:hypothetical protein